MKIQERRWSREIFGKDAMFEGYGKPSFGVKPLANSAVSYRECTKQGLETFQRGEGFLVPDFVWPRYRLFGFISGTPISYCCSPQG